MNLNFSGKILFIVPYPLNCAPSQRFRVELYLPHLDKKGIQYDIAPFMDENTWHILYKKGHVFRKITGVAKGFLKRFIHLIKAIRYDYIFIHREASPIGPPLIEWFLAKLLRKKIIYDFDDAIWLPEIAGSNKLAAWFKSSWKVKYICKWSYKVAGGNYFLCAYASNYTSQTVFLPTCVDIETKHNKIKEHEGNTTVIGWTGSHSTMQYLNSIIPALQELEHERNFSFLVISNQKPSIDLKNWQFIPWTESSEIEDLLKMDIGIMPLVKDRWSEGKCGFKLIQYLSCGIPAIADDIGVNKHIIEHGKNGFLCYEPKEWKENLKLLIDNAAMRKEFGLKGRKKIVTEYSIQSQLPAFLSLFK